MDSRALIYIILEQDVIIYKHWYLNESWIKSTSVTRY